MNQKFVYWIHLAFGSIICAERPSATALYQSPCKMNSKCCFSMVIRRSLTNHPRANDNCFVLYSTASQVLPIHYKLPRIVGLRVLSGVRFSHLCVQASLQSWSGGPVSVLCLDQSCPLFQKVCKKSCDSHVVKMTMLMMICVKEMRMHFFPSASLDAESFFSKM